MLNREQLAQDAIRTALGPTNKCPMIEELESFASGETLAVNQWTEHVRSCAYCQTELHLLRTFLVGDAVEATQDAVQAAELLKKKSTDILKQARPAPERASWWKSALSIRRMAQVSMAAAAILLVAGAVVFFRSKTYQPQLEAKNHTDTEVLRSTSFALVRPSGDVRERPKEIRWEQVSQAALYKIRLLEVDRSELWKVSTAGDRIEVPPAIQDKIVPSKTLFAEITAFDSSGNQVATTGLVRFRLVQKGK